MYRYRVTLEPLATDSTQAPLHFEAESHDDLAAILQRVDTRFGLTHDQTRAAVVGFKLLGEIVLQQRHTEPFTQMMPALRLFANALKSEGRS